MEKLYILIKQNAKWLIAILSLGEYFIIREQYVSNRFGGYVAFTLMILAIPLFFSLFALMWWLLALSLRRKSLIGDFGEIKKYSFGWWLSIIPLAGTLFLLTAWLLKMFYEIILRAIK